MRGWMMVAAVAALAGCNAASAESQHAQACEHVAQSMLLNPDTYQRHDISDYTKLGKSSVVVRFKAGDGAARSASFMLECIFADNSTTLAALKRDGRDLGETTLQRANDTLTLAGYR